MQRWEHHQDSSTPSDASPMNPFKERKTPINTMDFSNGSDDLVENTNGNDEESESETTNQQFNNLAIDNADQTILSIFWRSGKLGAAVYSTETAEVKLLNDIADVRPEFKILKHLFIEVRPTTVLTCNTISPQFMDRVKDLVNGENVQEVLKNSSDVGNVRNRKPSLNLISSKYFNFDRCKARVLEINLSNDMKDVVQENRANFLQTSINFNCRSTISAFGALLYFLDTHLSKMMLRIPSRHILSLNMLNLENLVWIDEETYDALEIFSSASHPSPYKWSNTSMREGFSIHALFSRCSSKIGARYLRILLCHPTNDKAVLDSRHRVVSFFTKAENEGMLKTLRDRLKNIRDLSAIIVRIMNTQATPTQWKTFYETIHNAIIVAELCHLCTNESSFFEEVSKTLTENLYVMNRVIETVVDFEASIKCGRFTVKHGAVPELDKIKEHYEDLPRIMECVAKKELERLPDWLETCSLIYLPEIGYLLGIPMWGDNLTEADVTLPDMNFKFILNNVIHYKTAYCEEMDEILGDSHLIVLKHETEIMYQIARYIRANVSSIVQILGKIRMLDCLLAFSDVAKEFDLVKPTLVDENMIEIRKGRHILQQLCVDTYVPNDFTSSIANSLIKIITGPNSCGKSVYLKQNALIVYLAHIGSFVPAEKATIGFIDHLHTRIHANESIASTLSTFMLDLRQIYSCLYNSTPRTLIVIDEFGKGTADVDGLALLAACVQNFISRDLDCPHILISTHYHTLKNWLPPSELVKYQTFKFENADSEAILYMYEVEDGFVLSSFAHTAAANANWSKSTLNRAQEVLQAIISGSIIRQRVGNLRTSLTNRRKLCLRQILVEARLEENLDKIVCLLENVRL